MPILRVFYTVFLILYSHLGFGIYISNLQIPYRRSRIFQRYPCRWLRLQVQKRQDTHSFDLTMTASALDEILTEVFPKFDPYGSGNENALNIIKGVNTYLSSN